MGADFNSPVKDLERDSSKQFPVSPRVHTFDGQMARYERAVWPLVWVGVYFLVGNL